MTYVLTQVAHQASWLPRMTALGCDRDATRSTSGTSSSEKSPRKMAASTPSALSASASSSYQKPCTSPTMASRIKLPANVCESASWCSCMCSLLYQLGLLVRKTLRGLESAKVRRQGSQQG